MKRTALVFLALSILPGPAIADSCWVDKVYQRENGMAVSFINGSPAQIYVIKDGKTGLIYYHDQGKYFELTEGNAPMTEIPEITVNIGDVIRLGNSGHDTCTMEAVIENGQKGLKASSFFYAYIPGQPPESREEFIPAE